MIEDGYNAAFKHGAAAASAEIAKLKRICTETYQVITVLANAAHVFDHPDIVRALDNLSSASNKTPIPHKDLLPWPKTELPTLLKCVQVERVPFQYSEDDR